MAFDLGRSYQKFFSKLCHEVYGLDISQSSINIAKEYDEIEKIKYVCGSAYSVSYTDKFFDIVLAMDMLEHVKDPELVTSEASRV